MKKRKVRNQSELVGDIKKAVTTATKAVNVAMSDLAKLENKIEAAKKVAETPKPKRTDAKKKP